MFKIKIFLISIALMFTTLFIFCNCNYAKYLEMNEDNQGNDWMVEFISDEKVLKDTHEIRFKVKDSLDVVNGKIAPGQKAVAEVEIDLTGTEYQVDVQVIINDSNLENNFKLNAKFDGEFYEIGTIKTVELPNNKIFSKSNGRKILELELLWENDDDMDASIEKTLSEIKLPITINVMQHI